MKISFEEFRTSVDDFYDYLGRDKKPSNVRLGSWAKKLSSHSGEDIRESFSWMKDNLDNIPYNLPKAIKNAIFMISRSKPTSQSQTFKPHMYGHCDDCEGTGIFKLLYFDKYNNRSEVIQYCSQCDNWRYWTNSPGQRISKNELIEAGYRFKSYNNCLLKAGDIKPMGTAHDIKNMAADLGKKKRLKD